MSSNEQIRQRLAQEAKEAEAVAAIKEVLNRHNHLDDNTPFAIDDEWTGLTIGDLRVLYQRQLRQSTRRPALHEPEVGFRGPAYDEPI